MMDMFASCIFTSEIPISLNVKSGLDLYYNDNCIMYKS